MCEVWVTAIRDRCLSARVPFFFKQWGGVRKSETGRTLNGRTYNEFPARSIAPVPSPEELLSIREELELA
jgi:protein gp37